MQIVPVPGGSWVNPAAQNQQAAIDKSNVHHATSATVTGGGVTELEQSSKTQDRDADERYDGPADKRRDERNGSPPPQSNTPDPSILSLPATDSLPESTLDLLG